MVARLFCLIVLLSLLVHGQASARDKSLADAVLAEINLARTSPRTYVEALRQFRRQFSNGSFTLPGSGTEIVTREGVAAVDEAIAFVARQKPLSPLTRSKGLVRAAMELVKEEGSTGAIGHSGSSGDMKQRIERHGTWWGRIGENISYGPATARLVVAELIIDDGIPNRGHRKNIFDRSFTTAGVACGPHPRFRNICVIDFSSGFRDH